MSAKTKPKILVLLSRRFELVFLPDALERLKALGEVTIGPAIAHNDPQCEEKLGRLLDDTKPEILVTGWGTPKFTHTLLKAHPQIRFVQHLAGTVRAHIEREVFVAENGPVVANWGNTIAPSVAEAALMLTLGGLRRVTNAQLELHVRKGFSLKVPGDSLYDRPVGLHGLGVISQEYAKLLKPFRCPLSAYSPNVPDAKFEELGVTRSKSLEELYGNHHIVAVHAGNTPENFHIVNKDILARIPDGGLIVNTARGEIIDTEALVAELKSGRIFAALDVYETEPLPEDSPLRGLENCMLMPHVGGPTPDWLSRMGENCIRNIERVLKGEEPHHQISLKVYDRST